MTFTSLRKHPGIWIPGVQVGMTRYFDVDELSYLHWSAEAARGLTPYKDFFLLVTPGFIWFLSLFFWLVGVSTKIFFIGRAVALVVFVGILAEVGLLFGLTHSRKWVMLPIVILSFLPMPYDKFLEIRPDNLSTFLALTGLVLEVFALTRNVKRERLMWFFSGFFYMASLLVLEKTIPFALVGLAVGILPVIGIFVRSPKTFRWQDACTVFFLIVGFFLPLAVFIIWLYATGAASAGWYMLTRAPAEIYFHWKEGYFAANLFFFPSGAFYGGNSSDITIGMVTNHFLWILGLGMGTYRLLTPFLHDRRRGRVLVEVLLGLTFVISVAGFIYFFPEKYSQYLIPIAVFIAYYAADALSVFFDWIEDRGGWVSLIIILLGFVYLLVVVTQDVNRLKLVTTNTVEIHEVDTLIRTIPLTARVVDLEGRMVFWRDAYPICCLPFDTYLPLMSHTPPSLALYLPIHPADYLFDGYSGRFSTLSDEDQAYIRLHFAPVPGWGDRLWKTK
jgi:hypothetical protein